MVEWGRARRPCLGWGPGFLHAAEVRMSNARVPMLGYEAIDDCIHADEPRSRIRFGFLHSLLI